MKHLDNFYRVFIALYLLSKFFPSNSSYIEAKATEVLKLDNTILYVLKMIKKQHQRTDIERAFNKVTTTIDFQHTSKCVKLITTI